jgi:endonuclease/exonuclease/phosphatase family metal-dependent hydrolase
MSIEQIEIGSVGEHKVDSHRPAQFRIISWNIERGTRLDAVSEFLNGANADLILLQEVDKNCRRTGTRNVAKELSQRLRMNYVFAVEFQELGQGPQDNPAYHGQATLSPWPLKDPRVLRFRSQSKFWSPAWWIPRLPRFQRRLGGRMALVTDVCLGLMRMTAYNLHLESRNGDELRCSQLCEVIDEIAQNEQECSVIVGGDFNFDVTGSPQCVAILNSGFKNPFQGLRQPTVVNSDNSALDCILTRGNLRVVAANVHSEITASDHHPLSVTARFNDAEL